MKQSTALIVGAIAGGALWVLLHASVHTPSAFLCVVISAWVGLGIFGIVKGEVTLAGRGGKSPKTFLGVHGRLVGLAILAASAAFTFAMLQVGN